MKDRPATGRPLLNRALGDQGAGRSIGGEETDGHAIDTEVCAIARSGRDPWVAIDVATDPVAHARALRRAHERSISGAVAPRGVRELVADSWQRSLAAGVAPEASGAPIALAGDELEAARERSPLAPAIEAILATVSNLDGDVRHVVAIGDADANLLWVAGLCSALC